jgi:hypothetical protein
MSGRDWQDSELQVAAVKLWEGLYLCDSEKKGQKDVAEKLTRLYPNRGAFDAPRVSRLCKHAIARGLATAPSTARLKSTIEVEELLKRVAQAEREFLLSGPLESELQKFCKKHEVREPITIVVPGEVDRPSDSPWSEFAGNAAAVAVDHINRWAEKHKRETQYVGVTWGKQLHYLAVAMMRGQIEKDRLAGVPIAVMPLVGLPIGGHRSDVLSSSEIARSLSNAIKQRTVNDGHEYDLQLVPAYLSEKIFSDKELPPLYGLLGHIEGWTKIFGPAYMPPKSGARMVGNAGEISKCNFILSSVSDINEPFGFSVNRRDPLAPFTIENKRNPGKHSQPVADCGGIPLWSEQHQKKAVALEVSFGRRWTGIRRHQWQDCVEQGFRRFGDSKPAVKEPKSMTGAILFVPTAQKAEPTLLAIRDRLANIVVLGRPCAEEMLRILKGEKPSYPQNLNKRISFSLGLPRRDPRL